MYAYGIKYQLFENILIVCIGNICRSPMAEGLFKQVIAESGNADCYVSSAGLHALVGHRADPKACQLMMKKSIDISAHRACQLNNEMIRKADLILVMELFQKNIIEEKQLSSKGKVFRLGEWGNFDIVDPYQKELSDFENSLSSIEQGVSQWVAKLKI
jgi:protein-tyrosine phosphatase